MNDEIATRKIHAVVRATARHLLPAVEDQFPGLSRHSKFEHCLASATALYEGLIEDSKIGMTGALPHDVRIRYNVESN